MSEHLPSTSLPADVITTVNPASEEILEVYHYLTDVEAERLLSLAEQAQVKWRNEALQFRTERIRSLGRLLTANTTPLSLLISNEMG